MSDAATAPEAFEPSPSFHLDFETGAPAGAANPPLSRVLRAMGLLFLAIGLVLLGIGGWLVQDRRGFVARSEVAEAVVTALRVAPGGSGPTYAPTLQFVTRDGRPVVLHHGLYASPPGWRVGERTSVRYEPDRPEHGAPDTAFALWFVPGLVLGIGALAAAAAGGLLAWARRAG